jgi:hypothetical protein
MADKKNPPRNRPVDNEEMEKHEPPHTDRPIPAPKFGSAGSGGAEFERLPEQHPDDDEITES